MLLVFSNKTSNQSQNSVWPLTWEQMSSPTWDIYYNEVHQVRLLNVFLLEMTMGYMAADLIFTYIVRTASSTQELILMTFHHVVIIYTYLYVLREGRGAYIPALLEIAEISTPFYHLRWFVDKSKSIHPLISTLVSVVFLVLFVAVRGAFFIWVAFYPLYHFALTVPSPIHVIPLVGAYLFVILNWYWTAFAIRRAYIMIFKKKKVAKKQE